MGVQATALTPLIQVYDMPEAIRFYCGTLGFELGGSSPGTTRRKTHFQMGMDELGGADLSSHSL